MAAAQPGVSGPAASYPPGPTARGPAPAATGSSQDTVVPPPRGLRTANRPPSASIRSLSPVSPEPRSGSAPPAPSSRTLTRSVPPEASAATLTTEACPCLVAFVSASDTT